MFSLSRAFSEVIKANSKSPAARNLDVLLCDITADPSLVVRLHDNPEYRALFDAVDHLSSLRVSAEELEVKRKALVKSREDAVESAGSYRTRIAIERHKQKIRTLAQQIEETDKRLSELMDQRTSVLNDLKTFAETEL